LLYCYIVGEEGGLGRRDSGFRNQDLRIKGRLKKFIRTHPDKYRGTSFEKWLGLLPPILSGSQ